MGKDMETNAIYSGDCKEILSKFPEESIDLIYLDPPFFTQKNYEVIWDDGYEIRCFKDAQWYGKDGKRREDIYVYIDWLKERIEQCHRVLKNTGSFFIHCDWHANAYIRVYILDKIFGRNNFRNEIIWHYTGRRMKGSTKFNSKHDIIFFYAKSNLNKLVEYPIEPYTREEYLKMKKQALHVDKNGREWIWGHAGKGKSHEYRIYIDEVLTQGRAVDTVWDIPIINTSSKERLGYPTQKPEFLLERIIKSASKPDDIVLDPMCGCGTTIAVCQKLQNRKKRKWIGIDISPTACKLMNDRLRKLGSTPKLIGMPATIKQLKKIQPFDFQNWVIQRLGGRASARKVGDMGIDGVTFDGAPIQVKQSDKVGRNVIDNFETAIRRYFSGSNREKEGIVVAFSFTDGAYNEAHRVGLEGGIKIELKTVEELLNEK